ncbi:MAG: MATE family efflux transporter [Oscillospiraceae bacterium]|nr:MATE family efflux transporter [Oscillospiraceae bacterium]
MDDLRGKKSIFDLSLLPTVFALAGPAMLEMAVDTAVQYIDTAMVGALGTEATAAVGSTSTVNWLVGGTVMAFGVGFLSYIAQHLGAGEKEKARQAAAQSVLAALTLGVLFTAVTLLLSRRVPVWMQADEAIRDTAARYFFIVYLPMLFRTARMIFGMVLRAAGDTKTPMRVGVGVNLLNVVLNFLLIYEPRSLVLFGRSVFVWGAGWGVIGAAAASAVSYTVGGGLLTLLFFRHPVISPRGCSLKPDKTVLLPCLRVSFPNMLQRFGTSLGYVAFAAMINALGPVSAAAHIIANTVESAFYIPGFGMMQAAATLTGNAIGARDLPRQKKLARTILLLETVLMFVSGALLFVLAPPLVRLFSKDAAVIALGVTVLRMVACSEPVFGVSIALEGMLQGAGKTKMPFIINMIGMWGVRILGTWICTVPLGLGLEAAWGCMIGHNILLCLLFAIYYLRGNWNPLCEKQVNKGEACHESL